MPLDDAYTADPAPADADPNRSTVIAPSLESVLYAAAQADTPLTIDAFCFDGAARFTISACTHDPQTGALIAGRLGVAHFEVRDNAAIPLPFAADEPRRLDPLPADATSH